MDTFTEVVNFFSGFGIPSQVVKSQLSQFRSISLSAAGVLLVQGAEQDYGYFIVSGTLRACHYGESGLERCKEFYFEGELCFLYSSWLQGVTAQYQIEAIAEAEVVRIPLSLLALPQLLPAKVALLQQQLIFKEQKEALLLLNTPEQRYRHLQQYWPHWVTKLNNIQIASYIGINPVSLSRLKARIKSEK
ncbi:Crp/Fnr family transcriptional regulator [Shewanella canadensis]|uniref:Crp/Fnr family transcriptional regulator n=1 Tax=Shewanella canadensis TaxID=271096 RepID=A0A3S0J6T6_9GAMM|nr:cyclic nucleotide-binding domain-containing protein [Shewanella canadensis]RTR39168.1 Crp/Fnr family transcriptional regulator [Shewanella canadensis]